jgi:RNA polymerase sigma-70 factor (ECF subfamily)
MMPTRRSAAADAAEDARLIADALAGDRRAFAALHRRHLDAVYAHLTRIVGPASERDDLMQQIFLDVYRALPRFRGDASFSTFLHRIVVNVSCEHLERQVRRRGRIQPLDPEQLDALIALAASPETRASQRQELGNVLDRLEQLSPKRRAAFVLVAVEGLSLEEAAVLLGARAPAVKQRVLEARRELAAALDRGGTGGAQDDARSARRKGKDR